jgi:hypothetical protein
MVTGKTLKGGQLFYLTNSLKEYISLRIRGTHPTFSDTLFAFLLSYCFELDIPFKHCGDVREYSHLAHEEKS